MSFLKILEEVIKGKMQAGQAALAPKLPTQDIGLPYGARIGGFAKIDDVAIFTASTLGSIIDSPKTQQVKICAISRVRITGWPNNLALHRFYLETGDNGDKERYIQVVSEGGVPKETIFFSSMLRLYPNSPGVIRFYTGEDEADRIGHRQWVFGRADLEAHLGKEQFARIGNKNELVYDRAIGDGDYHLPIQGVENRIDDAVGDTGMRQNLWCMPHVRTLEAGLQEHLFISLEEMSTRNGNRVRDVHVDFMIGIPLSINDFRIL